MTKKNKMELLAPAGSYDAARAAVNAGADAIYMGGPLFSARAYAESSKQDMLLDAIEFCHLRGVKVYMTLNTLMKEKEFDGLYEYVKTYTDAGLDAVIVQDLGILKFIRSNFPDLKIHMSTQATVTGPRYAKALQSFGVNRVVPARELSLEEIRLIKEAGVEVEIFAHGALCYSYSGQCLMSSMIGGRSGNRGRCAGTCRLPYQVLDEKMQPIGREDESYVLSMKDLNTLSVLKDMMDIGVDSLKIEGRMKSPLYVASVVSIYRKYLDRLEAGEELKVEESDLRLLREIFDRGGSTDGYINQHNGREMISLYEKPEMRVPDDTAVQNLKTRYIDNDKKIPADIHVSAVIGEPLRIRMSTKEGIGAEAVSEICPETASQRPVSRADIIDKVMKLGNTDFVPGDIDIKLSENAFIPMKVLNELRREAVERLRESILESRR